MTDFDPFAEEEAEESPAAPVEPLSFEEDDSLPEPLLQEMSEEDRIAFMAAATLATEELPPLTDEPLRDVIEAYAEKGRRARTPEPTLENARKDANASVFLEAWGEEVFLGSAYYRLWQAEWRHQCMRDEIIERQGERKTRK